MDITNSTQQIVPSVLEAHAGIPLNEGQLVGDVIFACLLLLFIGFSIIFRHNLKMVFLTVQYLFSVKERQSRYLHSSSRGIIFRHFMIFQLQALSSLVLFYFAQAGGLISPAFAEKYVFLLLPILLIILILYFQIKQLMYFVVGRIFFEKGSYNLWKNNYNAVLSVLGILMYIPVLWVIFISNNLHLAFILLGSLFVLSRLVIFYKVVRIFNKKGNNILYLILYLCAQEILPLVFLYEGLIYLYNFIETSTLWH